MNIFYNFFVIFQYEKNLSRRYRLSCGKIFLLVFLKRLLTTVLVCGKIDLSETTRTKQYITGGTENELSGSNRC